MDMVRTDMLRKFGQGVENRGRGVIEDGRRKTEDGRAKTEAFLHAAFFLLAFSCTLH